MAASVSNVVSTTYVSVGCNRTPSALDWGENDLVIFAASHSVVVYDPKFAGGRGKIRQTLCEHRARVNCVRWIPSPGPEKEFEFLAGSVDKTVTLWQCSVQGSVLSCSKKAVFNDLGVHVNSVDGCYYSNGQTTHRVIVAAGDSKVCVWISNTLEDEPRLLETFDSGSLLMLDCKIRQLPGSGVPLIACAGDDGAVHLYNIQSTDGQLSCVKNLKIPGHEDWVRSLAFTVEDNGDLLLASAAQDTLIRVWRINEDKFDENDTASTLQSNQGKFTVQFNGELFYKCLLETVLQGHENWVYGLHWQPCTIKENGTRTNPLRLLSCSMDKTMIIWGVDPATGLWLDQVRVGEVGGNTLGLYGCRFGNDGNSILAHGYQGALHLWHATGSEWKPGVVCGGHFDSVEDLIWDPSGEFIITVSTDQTSRLHAPWVQQGKEVTWHEIARPQVHGYDMACIASLGRFRFASGAEEKVVRAFDAPKNFLENFARICQIDVNDLQIDSSPQGAAVPVLGLSNKPIYHIEEQKQVKGTSGSEQYSENYFIATQLEAPPTEETLIQNTLWPEIQKLYGHGYELFSLAADPSGKLLVSACRAQHAEHAAIILWDTSDWSQIGRLEAHNLTVTQMAFSPDGRKLVSVSRDRTWAVHETVEVDGKLTLKTVAKGSGGSRILWSCHWSHDSRFFVTGSRDKNATVWEQQGGTYKPIGKPLECKDSITAVSFCPVPVSDGVYLLAVGQDDGQVLLFSWTSQLSDSSSQWEPIASLDRSQSHHATVKRLKFRPAVGTAGSRNVDADQRIVQLASCGADNTVKIYDVNLGTIAGR